MAGESLEPSGGPRRDDPPKEKNGRNSSKDVFVSYASQDATVADTVLEQLERTGLKCWIAPRDVVPGALYADEIVRAINEARIFVLILSEHAVASPHVGKELERASSKRRRIIALRTDSAPLTRAFEYFLSESQWIDVGSGSIERAAEKLAGALQRHLAPESAIAPSESPERGSVAGSSVAPRRLAMAAGAVLVVVLAYFAAQKFRAAKPLPMEQAKIAVTSIVGDKSIAVLPFTDMSEKKDQEYFADGVAEEVLDRLAEVPGLKVVGRASSFQFKGKTTDPASVGAALGVAYLLEGGVRRQGGRVRVTAQLVDAHTGSQKWSNHFDSDVADVLQVQDAIAAELARALQIAVEVGTTPQSSIKSAEGLDAYLRGLQSLERGSQEDSEAAVADFQKALSLDPTFAPAAIGLAQTYVYVGELGWFPTRIAFERAREAALLAQRLDPKSPSPHVSMARIYTYHDWDWAGADRELQQAFALGPRETNGVQAAAALASARGQWDEARQLAIEAITLDPLNANAHGTLGFLVYLRSGRLAESEQSLRRALQIAPEWGSGHFFLGETLMLQGNLEAALAEYRREKREDGQLEGTAMGYFAAGRKAESDAQLAEAIRQNGADWASGIAEVYAFRGEKDRAFEWLERAYEARDEFLYTIKGDPLLKNLEDDPRYKAFLRKMNLPD